MRYRFALAALAFCSATSVRAQGVPTTQPNLINIYIEEVKLGMNAAHATHEAGWPAAYGRAKSAYNYIALTSMTGRNEAWYVSTYQNHAAFADGMKSEESDTALASALGRLSRLDAQYLNGARSIQARAKPDLSFGAFPNIALQRFWEITWFRVKPGHEGDFEAAAKAYGSAAKRGAPATSFRTYEIIAGVPGPTYLIFSSVAGFGDFDKMMAAGDATMAAANKDEMAALAKVMTDGVINTETQRFRLDPTQSYVTKETRDQDPAFWYPKKK